MTTNSTNLDPLKTSSYDYSLPKELIATHPVTPADSARLLVYNRADNSITHSTFKNLMDFLPDDISVFLNVLFLIDHANLCVHLFLKQQYFQHNQSYQVFLACHQCF